MMAFKILDYKSFYPQLESPNLLLGNGFSIAVNAAFRYDNLFERAKQNGLSADAMDPFEILDTRNFEEVMWLLDRASSLCTSYGCTLCPDHATAGLNELREILPKVLTAVPLQISSDLTERQKASCFNFIEPYRKIFTTNYDLLLYWVMMYANYRKGHYTNTIGDGFGRSINAGITYISDYVCKRSVYFLHGALHLTYGNGDVYKVTWDEGSPLIAQISKGFSEGVYPLIVLEGSEQQKRSVIGRSGYLTNCLAELRHAADSLVVYGQSFGENDGHLAEAIWGNKNLTDLFISIYGDPNDARNKKLIQSCNNFNQLRRSHGIVEPLKINFFDAQSANIWG